MTFPRFKNIEKNLSVLTLTASWVSAFPTDVFISSKTAPTITKINST
jgi:hypothetical protein